MRKVCFECSAFSIRANYNIVGDWELFHFESVEAGVWFWILLMFVSCHVRLIHDFGVLAEHWGNLGVWGGIFRLVVDPSRSVSRCPVLRRRIFLHNVSSHICFLLNLKFLLLVIEIHIWFTSFIFGSRFFIYTVKITFLFRNLTLPISHHRLRQTASRITAHHVQLRIFSFKITFQHWCQTFKSHWKLRRLVFRNF